MKRVSSRLSQLHWPLVTLVILICLLGVYNLHSAAVARDPELYLTQAVWMAVAAVGIAVFMFVDYRATESIAYPFFIIGVILLLAVLGQGRVAKGASRWLQLGPVGFQPSELAKLGTVFCLARYFSTRMLSGGYSIGALVRPLNLSRPVAVILALVVFWSRPWLADPVGQLARALFKANPILRPIGDNSWFRVLMLLSIVAVTAAVVLWITRYEKRIALLSPWPPKRKKRLIVAMVILALFGIGAVFWHWYEPVLCDPIGVAVTHLVNGAAPGGIYTRSQSSMVLRVVLSVLAALYLIASLFSLRKGVTGFVEMAVAPADLVLVPACLILVQPDLGTAGIVLLIGSSVMLVVGLRLRSVIILLVLGVIGASAVWAGGLRDYQKQRILTFIDPEQDAQGAGWNAVQSMIAVGSGRWTGRGHKGGTQTQLSFLPEQHTDFAFSVWGEEQGFLGSSFLALLYFAVVIMGLSIASDARDHYGGLLAVGATAIVFWQAVINMCMVVGLFPVVGITLPLFSYGGSSVVTVMAAVGILLNVHWRHRVH